MKTIDRGILIALTAAVLFGASTPLAKALLGLIGPWMLAGLLYLGSGVGLAVIRIVRGRGEEASISPVDLPWLASVILFGGIVGPVLLMLGLKSTEASASSILLNLEGVFTMAIAWTVFRENVDRSIAVGAASILAGAAILSWRQGSTVGVGTGSLLIAGACVCWAIDNNLTRKLSAADPVQIAMAKSLVAGTANVGLALLLGYRFPDLPGMLGAAAVGFVGYGVSIVCFVVALRHLGTARTGAYFGLAPFIGAGISIAFLGDPVTPQFAVAAALMGIGLWLHLRERHEHEHVHEPLEHTHRHVHDAHHQHSHAAGDPPGEPHSHPHRHRLLAHRHAHYPDLHHRHGHS